MAMSGAKEVVGSRRNDRSGKTWKTTVEKEALKKKTKRGMRLRKCSDNMVNWRRFANALCTCKQ
jgi:hypothetical protein